jgi:hypothetical protein
MTGVMTTAADRRRPVVAVLYRQALPPRLAEIEEISDVRLTQADGLTEALDGADVLYPWHSFSPALQENWDAATSLQWSMSRRQGQSMQQQAIERCETTISGMRRSSQGLGGP